MVEVTNKSNAATTAESPVSERFALVKKLAIVQRNCPEIEKTKVAGVKYKWRYAPLNEVVEIVYPLFEKYGIFTYWTFQGSHLVFHTVDEDTGFEITSEFNLDITNTEEFQDVGKVITYMLNRILLGFIGVIAEVDTGGEAEAEDVRPAKSRATSRKAEVEEEYDDDEYEDDEDDDDEPAPRRSGRPAPGRSRGSAPGRSRMRTRAR